MPVNKLRGAKHNELVAAEPKPGRIAGFSRVKVVERIGSMDSPKTISLIAIHDHGIPTEFPKAAIEEAKAAQQLAPSEVGFRLLHAKALRLAGRPHESVELLTALEERDRAGQAVAAELALGWMAMDRPDKAGETWELVLRAKSDDLRAALEAGKARLKAGDRMRAGMWLDRAKAIAPESPEVAELAAAIAAAPTG